MADNTLNNEVSAAVIYIIAILISAAKFFLSYCIGISKSYCFFTSSFIIRCSKLDI
jgi:hypothetical protein